MPDNFVASEFPMVIIPYKEYEKLVNVAHKVEDQSAEIRRISERQDSLYALFGECLEEIKKIREYVSD